MAINETVNIPSELTYEQQYAQWLRDTRVQRAALADRVWAGALSTQISGNTSNPEEHQV